MIMLAILAMAILFIHKHWIYLREDVYDLVFLVLVILMTNLEMVVFSIVVISVFIYMWVSLP